MRIAKFNNTYSRRYFMECAGKSALGAGMLAPLWDVIAKDGDISKAYPEEALSLDAITKGAIKVGDTINADNVEHVRDLIDPGTYHQVSKQGRVIDVGVTTTDIDRLSPRRFNAATLRNKGKARLDSVGNVVTKDGKRWIGGLPFPQSRSAHEIVANASLGWGKHDASLWPTKVWDLDRAGTEIYQYDLLIAEYMAAARIALDPKPYMPKKDDTLRFTSFFFEDPNDVQGTSFLNIWPYDQRKFPDFLGWMPEYERVRRFPNSQRFEPLIPGSTMFLSDAWMIGDPLLTWGKFNFVGKIPWLGGVSWRNWQGQRKNWEHDRCGGTTGKKFFRTTFELIPEAYVVDLEPVGYSRAPYSKKRIWFDARTMTPLAMIGYDRNGEPWKQVEAGHCVYEQSGGERFDESVGNPYVSWAYLHSHDLQSDEISLFEQVEKTKEGHGAQVNNQDIYEQYCTEAGMRRFVS